MRKPHLTRDCNKAIGTSPTCVHCQSEHTANHIMCPMNPLNRPKKENEKSKATEELQKLKKILKENRDVRRGISSTSPANHTAPATYADAAIGLHGAAPQPPGSIGDTLNQLKDPECMDMFGILKKFIVKIR
ncbi:hypothetical protein NPIL_555521 [Nephila pilipes]|uniref:Uncharacterized protein n=1 Tax=Nephila pilipes TaxID=299642 RepID=A0A8X6TM01_NEPPI|nr:hypothetical protein NPIL_555521 [Nephila pilipes]